MQPEFPQNCPQCKSLIEGNAKRIIKDSCGHEKCRVCLLSDVEGCQQCLQNENNKCSDNALPIENHTTVITYNNVHNDIPKEFNVNLEGQPSTKDPNPKTILRSQGTNTKVKCKSSSLKKLEPQSNKRSYKLFSIPSHVSVKGEPPIFSCNICNSDFRTKSHAKYHEFCLGETKPHLCEVCSKSFVLKSQLHIHMLIHMGNRPHNCEKCGKSFREAGKLKRHMILHSDEKPHICEECGKCFKVLSSLKLHRLTHTGEKPYACKYCKMRFTNSSNLKKHMATHSDDKTHMCEKCGKKFKQKWALTVHCRSHQHKRDSICGICARAFINNKDLKRHESIHLDIKMYSCNLCLMSFRRKDNLVRHFRNAHPDKKAEIIKNVIEPHEKIKKPVVDNPNAINVITVSPIAKKHEDLHTKTASLPRTCMNGPLKLAFKTSAFKRNYNINRDYNFDSNSKGESSDTSNKPTKSHSVDTEKSLSTESIQINQNLPPRIFPSLYSAPNLSVDEFYANRPHVIKNIKFKIPENYPSKNEGLLKTLIPQTRILFEDRKSESKNGSTSKNMQSRGNVTDGGIDNESKANLLLYNLKNIPVAATSVIVNSSCQKNIHWRRRMSQNVASEKS